MIGQTYLCIGWEVLTSDARILSILTPFLYIKILRYNKSSLEIIYQQYGWDYIIWVSKITCISVLTGTVADIEIIYTGPSFPVILARVSDFFFVLVTLFIKQPLDSLMHKRQFSVTVPGDSSVLNQQRGVTAATTPLHGTLYMHHRKLKDAQIALLWKLCKQTRTISLNL